MHIDVTGKKNAVKFSQQVRETCCLFLRPLCLWVKCPTLGHVRVSPPGSSREVDRGFIVGLWVWWVFLFKFEGFFIVQKDSLSELSPFAVPACSLCFN